MLKTVVRPYFVFLIISMFVASTASAVPTNGDFSSGLDGWTVESGTVTVESGSAVFDEDPDYLMSSLSQQFTLPAGALQLSFERILEIGGGPANTDSFAASLLDADYNPLNPYLPDVTWFYYVDTEPDSDLMSTGVNLTGNIVTMDVSSFAGNEVILAFDFFSEDDGVNTRVLLDNVNVSVIPAPAALLLAGIGVGLVNRLRKAKIL